MSRYTLEDDEGAEPYVVIERQGSGVASFLLGAAVGAGLALLFAPRSGVATRRRIGGRAARVRRAAEDRVSEVTNNVADTFRDARRRVEERIDSARDAIDLKRRQVHRAMDAGRDAARDARAELEQRITETKAAYHAGAAVARAPLDPADGDAGNE